MSPGIFFSVWREKKVVYNIIFLFFFYFFYKVIFNKKYLFYLKFKKYVLYIYV